MATTTDHIMVVSAFDSLADAQRAVQDLANAGVSRNEISLVASDQKGEHGRSLPDTSDVHKTADGTSVGQNVAAGAGVGALGGFLLGLGALAIPGIGPVVAAGPLAAALGGALTGAAGGGVIGALKDAGVPDDDAAFYQGHLQRGGALITVHTTRDREDRISSILSRYDAVEVGERTRDLGDQGSTGFNAAAPTYTNQDADLARRTQARPQAPAQRLDQGEQVIPVVEEQLNVGKRAVERGAVRVFSRVAETPVQEQVSLREETVRVERRPVSRDVTSGDMDRLTDQVIEVREVDEVPVVQKTAQVVEEVVVGKEAHTRTETVSDTVRRTEVEVENLSDSSDRPGGRKKR